MKAAAVLRSISKLGNVAASIFSVLSIAPELTQALTREIQAEQQLSQENLGGSSAPTFQGFNITTKDAEVRLTKQLGKESILVVFNVNHSVDMDDDYEDEAQQEAVPVPVALPPFTVEITKGDDRLCFHLELVESVDVQGEYDFRVEEFYVAPAAKEGNEDVAPEIYASSGKYIDPDLHDLLFVRYLEERGFDAQFCKTLVAFATHYEHSQYVSLLNKIKAFVTK
uniref:Mitochondrial glyco protein n=1 Tax=Angiostrongylus cantonensis TaxID=6313 RepID=A0A0K0DC03_ANGCA